VKGSPPKQRPGAIAPFDDALLAVDELLEEHRVPAQRRPPPAVLGIDTSARAIEPALPHILVIDDDPFSAGLVDSCLRASGFVSACCSDPKLALPMIESDLPDLIILDVVMPGMDGFELCRHIRKHPALAFTPVIFVTRRGDVEQRVRGLEVGGNDTISKPFDPQELVARVRSHLQRLSALQDMALRDGLTRCFNHKHYKQRIEQELSRARRYETPFAVSLIDADRFKDVNDTWGHAAGDAALIHLANLVAAGVRSTDVVARYGGEEFGLLLIEAGATEAEIVTSRLRERIAGVPLVLPETREGAEAPRVTVTVSIGVAEAAAGDTVASLLGRADRALYEAKRTGRNRVCVAPRP
jgi:diguanylate cyclase (GGDEF)-like protein